MSKVLTLADYAVLNDMKDTLTLQDALDDAEFQHKYSKDKKRMFGFSPEMWRTLTELDTDADRNDFINAIHDYFNNGVNVLQNGRLDNLSAFTRSAVRQAIEAHNARIEADVISKYRKFVGGKAGAYRRYADMAGSAGEDDNKGF